MNEAEEIEALKKEVKKLKAQVNFLLGFVDGNKSNINL